MWTAEEIRALLPEPVEGASEGTTLGDIFMHHYGVKETGNVSPMKVRAAKTCPVLEASVGTCTPGVGVWQSSPKACGVQPLCSMAVYVKWDSPCRILIRS